MIKYEVVLSTKYKSALKKCCRHKDFDKDLLEKVVITLANGETLSPKYKDHQLIGSLQDYRECHIKSDLLLIYQKHEDVLVLLLVNIGSHSKLFK
jgi:mRNA interferase YafQ